MVNMMNPDFAVSRKIVNTRGRQSFKYTLTILSAGRLSPDGSPGLPSPAPLIWPHVPRLSRPDSLDRNSSSDNADRRPLPVHFGGNDKVGWVWVSRAHPNPMVRLAEPIRKKVRFGPNHSSRSP